MYTKIVLTILVGIICGCSNIERSLSGATGTIDGIAVIGPIQNAKIRVVRQENLDIEVAVTKTDSTGRFSIPMGYGQGSFLVCAEGGNYTEFATGTVVGLGNSSLCAWVANFNKGESRSIAISPWSQIVVSRSRALLHLSGMELQAAVAQAQREVQQYIGCAHPSIEILNAIPVDPTVRLATKSDLTPALLSGILLGGLSEQAKRMSESEGLTPGTRITSLSVLAAMQDDLEADGLLNGIGLAGHIQVQSFQWTTGEYRGAPNGLAQGIRWFLASERNGTGLSVDDAKDLVQCIGNASGGLFSGHGGSGLDLDGPSIVFLLPTPGATVRGNVEIRAEARDANSLVEFKFVDELNSQLTDIAVQINQSNGTLQGELHTESLPDGNFLIRAQSSDSVGNNSTASVSVKINNKAPTVTVTQPDLNATLTGIVTIEVTADDLFGIDTVTVVNPLGIVDEDPAPGRFVGKWNSSSSYDGIIPLRIRSVDKLGLEGIKEVGLHVDNYKEGRITGRVALESSVKNVQVELRALRDGVLAEVLGSVTTNDGSFVIAASDQFGGPVVVRAFGAGANYVDAATGGTVVFDSNDELLTVINYRPTPQGTVIENVSVNAWSTMATWLTRRYREQGAETQAALDLAHGLVNAHLRREGDSIPNSLGIDVRTTRVSDFTSDPTMDREESLLLGLSHVAMSRWGSEVAVKAGMAKSARPTMWLLDTFKEDLEDGHFDGKGALNHAIQVTPDTQLETNTLRGGIARSLIRWLGNVELAPGQQAQRNVTNLQAANFAQRGGFLEDISLDVSALFGTDAPDPFDHDGPLIWVSMAGGIRVRGMVVVTATASDITGVISLAAELKGGDSPAALNRDAHETAANYEQVTIDTTRLVDGPHRLAFTGIDGLGNAQVFETTFVVDNSPPVLNVVADKQYVTSQSAVLKAEVRDAGGMVTGLMVKSGDAELAKIDQPGPVLDIPVSLLRCGANPLQIRASDDVGNVAQANVTVVCDKAAPSILNNPSAFVPHSQLIINYLDSLGTILAYVRRAEVGDTEVNLAKGSEYPVKLDVYYTLLDNYSGHVPVLVFRSEDDTQLATVSYRYMVLPYPFSIPSQNPRWHVPAMEKRSSTLITPGETGQYRIPISYQDLHPELAISHPEDLHYVEVTAVDAAGNTSRKLYTFKLNIMAPPISMAECKIDESLQNYDVNNNTLHVLYQKDLVPVQRCKIRYVAGSTPLSLAPHLNVTVKVTNNGITQRVSKVANYKSDLPTGSWTYANSDPCLPPPFPTSCTGEIYQVGKLPHADTRCRLRSIGQFDSPVSCKSGILPKKEIRDAGNDPIFNSRPQLKTKLRVFDGPVEVQVASDGSFVIDEGHTYEMVRYAEQPELWVAGSPYFWFVGYDPVEKMFSRYKLLNWVVRERASWVPADMVAANRYGYQYDVESLLHELEIVAEPVQIVGTPNQIKVRELGVHNCSACTDPYRYVTTFRRDTL